MQYMATITSKRQFTIPSEMFKAANYKPQQKLLLTLIDANSGTVTMKPMGSLVSELAGCVPITAKYKSLSLDQMIEKARTDYFKSHK
ncbi:MAG: hypothetical protein AAB535_03135 [Patescibacteria group bacterium]